MHCYSDGQSYSKFGFGQTHNESGDTFRNVVDGDGSSCMIIGHREMHVQSVTQ